MSPSLTVCLPDVFLEFYKCCKRLFTVKIGHFTLYLFFIPYFSVSCALPYVFPFSSPSVCQCYSSSVPFPRYLTLLLPCSLSSPAPRPLISVFCVFKPLFPMHLSVRCWCLCDVPLKFLVFPLVSPVSRFGFWFLFGINFYVDLLLCPFPLFCCFLFY